MQFGNMTVHPVPGWKVCPAKLALVLPGAGEVYVLNVFADVAHVVGHLAAQRARDLSRFKGPLNVFVEFIQFT